MAANPQILYREKCAVYNLAVRQGLVSQLVWNAESVAMKMSGLTSADVVSAALSLEMLPHLNYLDLSENAITDGGVKALRKVLKNSPTLRTLKLASNNISVASVKVMSDVVASNTLLQHLDLSGNKLSDSDTPPLAAALTSSYRLKVLVLNHNQLASEAGEHLAKALACNDSLEVLDLSWNHIRGKGARAIADCIKVNAGLLNLDLAMNGFGPDGAEGFSNALRCNNTLLELNLSSNRINSAAVAKLCEGLQHNSTLQVLKLGDNSISSDGSIKLLNAIQSNSRSDIIHLDLQHVPVTQEFVSLYLRLLVTRPELTVYHGGYLRPRSAHLLAPRNSSQEADKGSSMSWLNTDNDPFHLLVMYLKKKQYRLLDMYAQFDVNKTWSVTKEQFIQGLQKIGIQLTITQMRRLVRQLDKDVYGGIDYSKLMKRYQTHMRLLRRIQYEQALAQKRQKQKSAALTAPKLSSDDHNDEEDERIAMYSRTHVRNSLATYSHEDVKFLGYKTMSASLKE